MFKPHGEFLSFTRFGILKGEESLLVKAAFEVPTKSMLETPVGEEKPLEALEGFPGFITNFVDSHGIIPDRSTQNRILKWWRSDFSCCLLLSLPPLLSPFRSELEDQEQEPKPKPKQGLTVEGIW